MKVRSNQDRFAFRDVIADRNGELSMRTVAKKITQNNKSYYIFSMKHRDLQNICETHIFTQDNQSGDQRPENKQHARKFADAIKHRNATRPHSLVVSAVGFQSCEQVESLDSFEIISFEKLRLTDGQHGKMALDILASEDSSIPENWEWSIVAIPNGSNADCQLLHTGINTYQKKADKSVNKYIEYKNNNLPELEMLSGWIFDKLADDPDDNVIYGRVKRFHREKNKQDKLGFYDYVCRVSQTERGSNKNVFVLAAIKDMPKQEIYELIRVYYNTWAHCNKHIWEDRTAYMFGLKMGLKVLTKLMYFVFRKAQNKYKDISKETVKAIIRETSDRMKKTANGRMWIIQTARGNHDKWYYGTERELLKEMIRLTGCREFKR